MAQLFNSTVQAHFAALTAYLMEGEDTARYCVQVLRASDDTWHTIKGFTFESMSAAINWGIAEYDALGLVWRAEPLKN